jgi:hypothetical protein
MSVTTFVRPAVAAALLNGSGSVRDLGRRDSGRLPGRVQGAGPRYTKRGGPPMCRHRISTPSAAVDGILDSAPVAQSERHIALEARHRRRALIAAGS